MLYAITFVKEAIFYRHMPAWMKERLRASLLGAILLAKGIRMEKGEGGITLSKAGLSVIIPGDEDALLVARNFEKLFNLRDMRHDGGRIDFVKGVEAMGYKMDTTPAAVLEIESAIREYNRFYKIRKGDVVFDCGAFHGLYGMFVSRDAGDGGKIYCFEPDDRNFMRLEKNIRANGIKNVIPVKKGLWNRSGKVRFSEGSDHGSHILIGDADENGADFVDATTLEDFCRERRISRLDFVKMDIEGAELEAIEGSLNLISKSRINFGIASYHVRNGEKTFKKLETIFSGIGYRASTSNPGHLTTYAGPKNQGARG